MRVRRGSLRMARSSTVSRQWSNTATTSASARGDRRRRPATGAARRRGGDLPDGTGSGLPAGARRGRQGPPRQRAQDGRRRHARWWGWSSSRRRTQREAATGVIGHLLGSVSMAPPRRALVAGGMGVPPSRPPSATTRPDGEVWDGLAYAHAYPPRGWGDSKFLLLILLLILVRVTVPKPFPIPLAKPVCGMATGTVPATISDCMFWVITRGAQPGCPHPASKAASHWTVPSAQFTPGAPDRRQPSEQRTVPSLSSQPRTMFRVGRRVVFERVGQPHHARPRRTARRRRPPARTWWSVSSPRDPPELVRDGADGHGQDAGQQRRLWSGQEAEEQHAAASLESRMVPPSHAVTINFWYRLAITAPRRR